jgi:lipopolysaccharide export system protein LptA
MLNTSKVSLLLTGKIILLANFGNATRLFIVGKKLALSLFHIVLISCFYSVILPQQLSAQDKKQIEIVQAGSLEGVKVNGVEVRRLIGDVIFKQEDTYMYCDSAFFYEITNSIDAYGTIRIEGPKVKLYGDVLHYNGNLSKADITGKTVRLTDGKMDLTTTAMQYDLEKDIGEYQTGGKVVDKDNVLTSKKGYYYSNDRIVFFKDSVVLTNPKYVMKSDTLKYNTSNSTAYFFGPTHINSTGTDSSHIYCEDGWYNTETEKSRFTKNAYIESKVNRISGDSLLYDRITRIGRAWSHVALTDTVEKIIISGDYAYLNELSGNSFVTGSSLLTKAFETDSLFMHADTLFATQDTATKQKTYFAYHHVRLFKTDLQAQCDSLVYSTSDSTIWFYTEPILWSNKNQMTAEKIALVLKGNKINTMHLYTGAFIAGMEDSLRYNQVKGRDMTGYFTDNKLSNIEVTGNGQSIYYLRNKKQQLTGVNQADCSNMIIYLKENKISKISLLKTPDATLFPVKETDPLQLRLKDFSWKGHLQPLQMLDIFNWPENGN